LNLASKQLGVRHLSRFSRSGIPNIRPRHRAALLVERRASSPVQAESRSQRIQAKRPQANQRSASFFHPPSPCHPERSPITREAHDPAKSKDPYTTRHKSENTSTKSPAGCTSSPRFSRSSVFLCANCLNALRRDGRIREPALSEAEGSRRAKPKGPASEALQISRKLTKESLISQAQEK
jgi:hypothetical protein